MNNKIQKLNVNDFKITSDKITRFIDITLKCENSDDIQIEVTIDNDGERHYDINDDFDLFDTDEIIAILDDELIDCVVVK